MTETTQEWCKLDVYGTLGFTPNKFLPTLRGRPDVSRAVVFHDAHPDSKAAARDVAEYCKELGVRFEPIEVDAFDMVACAAAMQAKVRTRKSDDITFNVTGGTKVLNAAAVLTCILEGVPAVYLHEETGQEIPLPLITVRYEKLLSRPQGKVLRFIIDNPGCVLKELVAKGPLSKPTMSHHVKELVDYGLVERRPDAKDGRLRRLHAIPSARLLLDETP